MSDSKRQCSKCQFFQIAQLSGNGWCTHPKRRVASDVKILVREKELACRNSWGDDLWVDAAASPKQPDVVSPPRKGVFFVNNRVDDEVTSVVDTTARPRSGDGTKPLDDGTDDIVTLTSVRQDGAGAHPADDLNAPAIADQAERARLMARGNKDAIQKARERHTQRRKPARETVAADPADATSDRILTAQDRDLYNRDTATDNRSAADDFRNTPPVPREEVNANNATVSPANGTDERFDSRAQLKPEVDLSQLRGFLNRSGPPRRNPGDADPRGVTSYDLVLKRAQEIKAAGDIEREYRGNTIDSRQVEEREADPAQRPQGQIQLPSAPVSRSRPGVVWDVEGERLNIAFERARVAIDQPIHLSPGPLDPPDGVEDPVTFTASRRVSARLAMSPEESLEIGGGPKPMTEDDNAIDEDWCIIDAANYGGGESYEPGSEPEENESNDPPSLAESPRTSWWRSLNFGRKRRYRSEPTYAYEDYDDLAAEGEYAATDGAAIEGGVHDDDEDGRFELGAGYVDTLSPGIEAADDADPIFATSDESWLQDEWEFPEPQPAEWHETRAKLLEYASKPMTAGVQPTGVAVSTYPGPPTQAALDEAPAAYHLEQLAGVLPDRSASSAFAFDEPSGMDAFRAALFGDSNPSGARNGVFTDGNPTYAAGSDRPLRQVASRPSRRVEPEPYVHDRLADHFHEQPPGTIDRYATFRPARISTMAQTRDAFDSGFDIRDAIADGDDAFDRQFEVASRVPKSCSTCRSFQASDNGERGWCLNDYSKTYRQMVNSDDLACRSSIGDWWLAADTSWIPPTDVIQPETPRTDRLVARSSPRDAPVPRTGRHVRTSKVG
ncbi:MAG: hypothetical protein M3457_10265 [Chloroflexota bacterium]|nr:hypothetical protein [Chloroflexota bacterium]